MNTYLIKDIGKDKTGMVLYDLYINHVCVNKFGDRFETIRKIFNHFRPNNNDIIIDNCTGTKEPYMEWAKYYHKNLCYWGIIK